MNTIETKVICPKCGNTASPLPDKLFRCHFCEKRSRQVAEMRETLVRRFPSLRGVGEGGRHDG